MSAQAVLFLVGAAVVLVGARLDALTGPPTSSSATLYQEFMTLPQGQPRVERFRRLGPEDQALIIRTHAERWRDENRGRLSRRQLALVENAIAFLTPAFSRASTDAELDEEARTLTAELECALGQSEARNAFDPLGVPQGRRSWLTDMLYRIERCILG